MHTYVIGDIHGCLAELVHLIEALPLQPNDRLVFLGDYIDRGSDSKGVVSYLLNLRDESKQEVIFLKGNHEDMLLSFIGLGGQHGDMFLYNGGHATLSSYGISSNNLSCDAVRSQLPGTHLEFFRDLRTYYIMEPFLCVHAGIHPAKPLENQTESELLWIRSEFISNSHRLPYTVLFGHTPQNTVLLDLPYKIGLDTGLVYGNKLSCLETSERVLYQISHGKKTVKQIAIKDQWHDLSSRPMA